VRPLRCRVPKKNNNLKTNLDKDLEKIIRDIEEEKIKRINRNTSAYVPLGWQRQKTTMLKAYKSKTALTELIRDSDLPSK